MLKKLIHTGIRPEHSFALQNKIRIFNTSLLVILFINTFYLFVGISKPIFVANAITITYQVILLVIFLLIRAGRHNLAFHLMVIFGICFLFTISLMFGEEPESHVYLLFIPLASVVLFDGKRCIFLYFLFAMGAMSGAKLLFPHLDPPYPDSPANQFGVINLVFTGILLYLGLIRFKNENLQFTEKINLQKTQVEKANALITVQKKLVEEKNKNITDSIVYARRIQDALLTNHDYIAGVLKHFFIVYKPKDIVSGDFYWCLEKDGFVWLATADCTGHGVSGAFMSILGMSFLNELILDRGVSSPAEALTLLRSKIIYRLNPDGREDIKDGMDMTLCRYDFKARKMAFAGANRELIVARGGELSEYRGDKIPVSAGMDSTKPFTLHEIELQEGNMVYTFTDGFQDQFGGEKNKKFRRSRMKELLRSIADKPAEEQKEILEKTLAEWQGNLEQTDDVMVIGVRIC